MKRLNKKSMLSRAYLFLKDLKFEADMKNWFIQYFTSV